MGFSMEFLNIIDDTNKVFNLRKTNIESFSGVNESCDGENFYLIIEMTSGTSHSPIFKNKEDVKELYDLLTKFLVGTTK